MPKSPEVLAEQLVNTAQKAEESVRNNWRQLEQCQEVREEHAGSSRLGYLHPEVVGSHLKLAVSVPKMAIESLGIITQGIYRQKRYSKVTSVDFDEALPDAMDRCEKAQNLD